MKEELNYNTLCHFEDHCDEKSLRAIVLKISPVGRNDKKTATAPYIFWDKNGI